MTRNHLIQAIYDNDQMWSCPLYSCDLLEREENSGDCCLKCAERQLAEYEARIRAEALDDFERKIKECCSVVGSCDFEDMAKIKEQLKESLTNERHLDQ